MGQRCSPLLVQCWSIVYDADPALIYHRVCCILCANTCHSTNTVSMLTHSIRRWPVIKTALSDCTVFSYCCIMLGTFKIPVPETPDNTIHWPNADVMLCHRLRRWTNIIPTKTLYHKYNREYYYFEHLLKTKVLNLRTWNVIFGMFIRTGVQKCQAFPTRSTYLSPK